MKSTIKILLTMTMVWFAVMTNAQQPKTALDLNNRLASITDSLYSKGQDWGNKFVETTNTRDFASLKPYRENIQHYIASELKVVKGMKDINGSENLRNVIIEFLNYENKMIDNGFVPVEKLPQTASDDDVKKVINDLAEASKDEADLLKRVSEAQDSYAKKNGFTIEAPAESH
ncbi:LIC11966 family surface protein [Taibaiella soli]|uniref:DUF4142 domain-containing protein n=1 Tax=Taibaiella soli TaxID=1649169 RepID=A0A2W2BBP0_9BACT|nr:hypothetical protein [Taibaiella soli]PZF73307.1 hypothetical protein DN068_09055 [Taibaiella soli]